MFTSRQVKHSRLLLRHARKYLRYKDDLLSSADRDQIIAGMKDLREALSAERPGEDPQHGRCAR